MTSKTLGTWLVIVGILILLVFAFYKLFEAGDVPMFVKVGIALVIIGIVVFIPAMIKEAKKDKFVVK